MKRVEISNILAMALTFLAIVPKIECQVRPTGLTNPRPLCPSQFALVNYACGRLPFRPGAPPGPPPAPPSPDDDGGDDDGANDEGYGNNHHEHEHRHGHGHSHRHGHKHRHHLTQEEENCCRWAREVDSQCVCELLVRLPPFLIRPLHIYTLTIGEDCQITYSCGGPI
ncbi:unnamed protein product [Vicia faba]|uniref:Bifunctional inhibitor/plant lipid transfer protein/seed storage helical domain-containing protein n=1 Tax=Vicia faba TaxID=3906 RepID=A0AAV1AWB6_VICFA|nr:unnamed protein product [Vicia faba]